MTKEQLIFEYLNGKSISALMRETNYTRYKIEKILKEYQVTIRGGRKKIELNKEQIEILKQQYYEGIAKTKIAKNIKCSVTVVNRTIEELQLEQRSSNRVNKRIIDDYFSVIDSQDKAYWLGFLFTDGSVDHYRASGRIRLQLQEADKEILEKFKEDLQLDCQIIYDKRANSTCCSVEFTSEQMFNDLEKYGIVPRKTYVTEHIPYELIPSEYLYAFILGLYDGDGGLSCSANFSTDVAIQFTSYHESIVKEFQYLIDNYILHKEKSNQVFFTSAWHTAWRGRLQVLKILDTLYANSNHHLKRKYDKYLALKNSLN